MAKKTFRAGSRYTIEELAELARRGVEQSGLTQAEIAERLNRQQQGRRGEIRRTQISMALNDPSRNLRMLLLLLETFTDYEAVEEVRYVLKKKS